MAVCHTTWKVLPHRPIEKIDDRLWRVEGKMDSGTKRIQSIIRLDDGRLLLHNAIALDEAEMAEIDAWGEVAAILVPNAFHRMDCRIMSERYPRAKVYAPAGAAKAVGKATAVHGTFADVPSDAHVRVAHLPGVKEKEGVVEVQGSSGLSLVLNDMLLNVPDQGFPKNIFLGPMGRLSIPRFARVFFVSDKAAVRKEIERLADIHPARLVPGHGEDITESVSERLRENLSLL